MHLQWKPSCHTGSAASQTSGRLVQAAPANPEGMNFAIPDQPKMIFGASGELPENGRTHLPVHFFFSASIQKTDGTDPTSIGKNVCVEMPKYRTARIPSHFWHAKITRLSPSHHHLHDGHFRAESPALK